MKADSDVLRVAIVFVAVDLLMIAPALVSVAAGGIDGFDGGRLDLRFDRTVPEVFGYAQLGFAIVALVLAGRLTGHGCPSRWPRSGGPSTPCATEPMSVR